MGDPDGFIQKRDAMRELRPLAADRFNAVNIAVVAGLWAAGTMNEDPALWFAAAKRLLVQVLAINFGTAIPFQVMARAGGKLIQSSASAPREHVLEEVLQTVFGFGLVLAPLLAWPVANAHLGRPSPVVSTLADCFPPPVSSWPTPLLGVLYAVMMAVAWMGIDAYNYWKHRLFHSHLLWSWHKHHHSHRNPSALAGYAISPVYGLATFWPIALLALPWSTITIGGWPVGLHQQAWAGVVGFYMLLNHYLHCGYVIEWFEAPLAPLGIMTSKWHNTHHNRGRRGWHQGDQTFGEVTVWWDRWMGTCPHGEWDGVVVKTHCQPKVQ